MTQRTFVWAVLVGMLLPGCLIAQERGLRGKLVHLGDHDEKVPEVNLTVMIEENGNTDTTTSQGLFRIVLPDIFKPGDKVTLRVEKPGWRVYLPVGGEIRIPAELHKEMVEVHLLPVGSKHFLSPNHLEKLFQDLAEQSKKNLTPDNKPVDFSRTIKDWAVKYGFSAQQAKAEIDKWIAEVKANEDDPAKLGLAAFAEKNFRKASQLFTTSAEQKAQRLAEIRQEEGIILEEIVRDYRHAGDAHANSYMFDDALTAYERALSYVTKEHKPQLWAATLNDIGGAHWQRGIRAAGTDIHDHLTAAIQAYRQALEVYTRSDLPQDWAHTHNNLAKTLFLLQDWPHAVTSYINVLSVYPDDREAYQTAGYLYHEKLFQFSQAFVLNQQWLERHPDDLAALSDFAEKHLTTGRFAECAQRLTVLLANPAVEPQVSLALRALEIANLLALDQATLVPGKIDTMLATMDKQPEDVQISWTFEGTLHFISQHGSLTS